jgi:hypothetical protein
MLALLALSWSTPALPCSPPLVLPGFRFPTWEGEVPTNVVPRVVVDHGSDIEGLVLLEGETEVPGTVTEDGNGLQRSWRFDPDAPLSPGAQVAFAHQPEEVWQIGEAADHEPPGEIELLDMVADRLSGFGFCSSGPGNIISVILSEAEDDSDLFYEIEVEREGGEVDPVLVERPSAEIGTAVYASSVELDRGETVWLRARAVDAAGNEGPWTEQEEIRTDRRAMCATGPGGGAALWLIGAALLRRRVSGAARSGSSAPS